MCLLITVFLVEKKGGLAVMNCSLFSAEEDKLISVTPNGEEEVKRGKSCSVNFLWNMAQWSSFHYHYHHFRHDFLTYYFSTMYLNLFEYGIWTKRKMWDYLHHLFHRRLYRCVHAEMFWTRCAVSICKNVQPSPVWLQSVSMITDQHLQMCWATLLTISWPAASCVQGYCRLYGLFQFVWGHYLSHGVWVRVCLCVCVPSRWCHAYETMAELSEDRVEIRAGSVWGLTMRWWFNKTACEMFLQCLYNCLLPV